MSQADIGNGAQHCGGADESFADNADTLLGVVSIGWPDHSVFDGRAELKHLYVVSDAQGQGIGELLFRKAVSKCEASGDCGIALAVVRQNERARSFYKKMGGVEVSDFTDAGPLWRSDDILVAWDF